MSEEHGDRLKLVSSGPADTEAERARYHELDWTILMGRAQDGDAAAYLRLLQEITPYLRSLVVKYHRDPRDVEDTVQDILLTVHSVRETYDPSRPFAPWLVGIANRRAFDRLRSQGRQRAHEFPLSREHDAVATAENIEEAAQQQAINMLKIKEMSLKEAASESGMTVSSLKVATHRALKSLRRMLSDRGEH
jgi:DNA-directed RNA polymerase specialized sigma24 family protein